MYTNRYDHGANSKQRMSRLLCGWSHEEVMLLQIMAIESFTFIFTVTLTGQGVGGGFSPLDYKAGMGCMY